MLTGFLLPLFVGAISAAIGAGVQWWIAPAKVAEAAHFALGMILAIYIGARLVSGDLIEVLWETGFASVMLLASLASLRVWPRGVGIIIIGHGLYDQFFAHSAGLPEWYPPFCGAVDIVLGLAVLFLAPSRPTVLTH